MNKFLKKVATLPLIIIYLITALFGGVPFSRADDSVDDEQVFYYLTDHLGGIDAVVDENGTVVERTDYLPFGDERMTIGDADGSASSPQSEDYGYTGKEKDDETGLNYYGARYYDSKLGRFTQIDPLVLNQAEKSLYDFLSKPQSFNEYTYTLNNPIKYIDPDGKTWKDFFAGYGVGVVQKINSQIDAFNKVVNSAINKPVDTIVSTAVNTATKIKNDAVQTYNAGKQLTSSLLSNPVQAGKEILTGLSLEVSDFLNAADYDKGEAIGYGVILGTEAAIGFKITGGSTNSNLENTLNRIKNGEKLPYKNDGSTFFNREGLLPEKPEGYYKEYVHPTSGTEGPGAQRIIQGKGGEVFHTSDHYKTFKKIK